MNITGGASMGIQDETRSQSGNQAEMQCDLTSVDNLLRLLSVHAAARATEDGASKQGAPVAETRASAER
jgi:hypothetical protein